MTTGNHDDKVIPEHSFKFAAELQEKQKGKNPTLICIETDDGYRAANLFRKLLRKIQTFSDVPFFIWVLKNYQIHQKVKYHFIKN